MYHGEHLMIDGKNIGYYGGEVTFEDKPLTLNKLMIHSKHYLYT